MTRHRSGQMSVIRTTVSFIILQDRQYTGVLNNMLSIFYLSVLLNEAIDAPKRRVSIYDMPQCSAGLLWLARRGVPRVPRHLDAIDPQMSPCALSSKVPNSADSDRHRGMTLRVGKMASIIHSSHLIGLATHAGLR